MRCIPYQILPSWEPCSKPEELQQHRMAAVADVALLTKFHLSQYDYAMLDEPRLELQIILQ
jgi:hypothetical protein